MKNPFKEDLEKLKKMPTFKQKYDYIWGYYKWGIVGIIVGIIIITSIITTTLSFNRNAITLIACDVQCMDTSKASQVLNDAFADYLGDEADDKEMITLDTSISFRDDLDAYNASIVQQKLTALVAAHTANMMIADREPMTTYGALGMFADLEEILDPALFELLKSRDLLFTATIPADTERDEPTPEVTYYCGIDISGFDNALLKEAGFYISENAAIGIPANANNQDRAIAFLDLLLSEITGQ